MHQASRRREYAQLGDPAIQRQIEGVRKLRSRPIIGPFPAPGPRSFVRGLEVSLECEEQAFVGHGAFMLAGVLCARAFGDAGQTRELSGECGEALELRAAQRRGCARDAAFEEMSRLAFAGALYRPL